VSFEQNDIDELITRVLTGEASADDEQRLKAWMTMSDDNALYYKKLQKAAALADQYYRSKQPLPEINLDAEWNQFLGTINQGKKDNVRTLKPATLWLRIAAAVLLVATSGVLYNYFIAQNLVVVETAAVTKEVTLPDGSQITLNQNSRLTYNPSFGKTERGVTLQGEAFFEITPDPTKPFIISVDHATVEVVGTSFNIRGYDLSETLEVTVATGIVKLSAPDKMEQLTLQAGDRGIYNRSENTLTNQTNVDVNYMAWKTRKLTFTEANLQSVIETLNKVYDANIIISAQVPDTCLVTVSFDQQSLEAILNVLKSTLNLEYKIQNNKIEITQAGC
jgi:transmembrane sensor